MLHTTTSVDSPALDQSTLDTLVRDELSSGRDL